MTPHLLDTNILVDILRGRNGRRELAEELLAQGHPLASCAITVAEVYADMRPKEEPQTRALLSSLVFLATTEEIAEKAGRWKAQYARRGKTLTLADTTIAAVAGSYGCVLVTENVRDFPMPELRIFPLGSDA